MINALKTERLLLREFSAADLADAQAYGSDPDLWRYKGGSPETEEDTRQRLERTLAHQQETPRLHYDFALVQADSGQLIGRCNLYVTAPQHKEAEVGYTLRQSSWGCGFATEAAMALVQFGFHDLGLHRLFVVCHPDNAASERVMLRIGMRREGLLRERRWAKGVWQSSLVYSILDHE